MPRDKVRLTSSKDTAGSATFGAMSPLFPMQLSSSVPGRGVTGLSLVRGDARGPLTLLVVLSLWLAVPGNLPLWQRVAALTETADHRLGLMLTLGLVLVAGTLALLALCHWPRVFRPLATVLVLATAFNSHFMWQYGVVIDSTMMANVAQTNANEVRDLLSWPLLWVGGAHLGWFVLGMVVMFICLCRMSRMSNKHRWGPRLSYVSLFTASFTLSFAPWLFGAEFVRLGAALFSLAVIGHLVVISLDWRRGEPPKSFETAPAPLEGEFL